MNIKQDGLGKCPKHGIGIMQAINQPGIKGVCFACQEEAQPKTGHTVIVNEDSDTLEGGVTIERVDHPKVAERNAPSPSQVSITLNLEEMYNEGITRVLLTRLNEAIDNMPPPATIKESKRIFKLQEHIEALIKRMDNNEK